MTKLVNFSIETDHLVLLQFKNGQERRVPVDQLASYLTGRDLEQVSAALELRRGFLRTHMPKAGLVLVLAASSLAALIFTSGARVAAQLLQRGSSVAPVPAHDQVVQQIFPGASPTATPASNHDIHAPVVRAETLPQPRPARLPLPQPDIKPPVASRLSVNLQLPPVPPASSQLDLRVTPMPAPPAGQFPAVPPTPTPEPTPAPAVDPSTMPGVDLPMP